MLMDAESLTAQGLCGVMEQALIGQGVPPAVAAVLASRACEPVVGAGITAVQSKVGQVKKKAKRTVGTYQKRLGKELKRLKAKHPRTPVSKLMKRAHSATKRALR